MAKWMAKDKEIIEKERKAKYEGINQEDFAYKFDLSLDNYKRFIGTKDKNSESPGIDKHIAEKICQALDFKLEEVAEPVSSSLKSNCAEGVLPENFTSLCRSYSAAQCQKLSSNPLTQIDRKLSDIFVPLGLIELKEQAKVENSNTSLTGSHFYQQEEIQREFTDNKSFYQTILIEGDTPKSTGKKIAIIGEPGAGKTTQLQKVGNWLIEKSSEDTVVKSSEDTVVIWISLAEIGSNSPEKFESDILEKYILNTWLKRVLSIHEVTTSIKHSFIELFKKSSTWLLLDGVDEIQNSRPLQRISLDFQGWISQAKVILTCRLNHWYINRNELYEFDVFRNLDFSNEQQQLFIEKYFDNKRTGISLIKELQKTNKARIRDLVKNPLRLTLLCQTWQRRQGSLPDTKAELYKCFSDDVYEWKDWDCTGYLNKDEARKALDKALGELSKEAIDSNTPSFRLTHRLVSKHLGSYDSPLYKLAMNIGWLNKIGVAIENPDETVYSFFHATFQEYFAALAIDDWDYLLPSDHNNENPEPVYGKKYRAFQSKWKQVVLFWLEIQFLESDERYPIDKYLQTLECFNDGLSKEYLFYSYQSIELLLNILDLIKNTDNTVYLKQTSDYNISAVWSEYLDASTALELKYESARPYDYLNFVKNCLDVIFDYSNHWNIFYLESDESIYWNLFDELNINKPTLNKFLPKGLDIDLLLQQAHEDTSILLRQLIISYNASSLIYNKFNSKFSISNLSEDDYIEKIFELMSSSYFIKDHIVLGACYCLLKVNNRINTIKVLKYFCDNGSCYEYIIPLLYEYSLDMSYQEFYRIWHGN